MSNVTSIPTQIRDQFKQLSPPFLAEGNGERFGYVMGLMSDLLLEKAFQATTIRIPGAGDPSQIPWLANDRVLVQGPAESNANFIVRLQTAFAAWKKAGSRVAVLEQLQAYMQNLQPGVVATLPEMTIVGGNASTTTWSTLFQNTPLGAPPSLMTVPNNWNWDGVYKPWRTWLVLYMALVPTGQSGTNASWSVGSAALGGTGQNVGGVWVPNILGTVPGSNPFVNITGLTGITNANLGQWITTSGGGSLPHRGSFQIVVVNSATSVKIAYPGANLIADAGPYNWTIGSYPYIGPGPVLGFPGVNFGDGISPTLPLDTGSNVGGVWQPTVTSASATTRSFGLNVAPTVLASIRTILKRWKSAGAYYPHIIVAFDGGDQTAGYAFSPLSTPGNGNPDGSFGGHGTNVNGVFVPNRLIGSTYDCYCDGTAIRNACSVPNIT